MPPSFNQHISKTIFTCASCLLSLFSSQKRNPNAFVLGARKRCPFQWLMKRTSWTLSEGALGSDGTGRHTAAARAGSGCSTQRATTSGIKSRTFFPLSENLLLRGYAGSVEKKQKWCCLPESIASASSRKGAERKNSACTRCQSSQILTGVCDEA